MMNQMKDDKPNDENLSGAEWWKQHLKGDEQPGEDPNQQYWNGISDYGMRKTGDPDYGPIPEEYESNPMSRTAFTCGVISVICIFLSLLFPGASFVVGALGILFALLSRRGKLCRQARAAILMCSIGMASFALMFVLSVVVLVSTGTWDFMMEKVRQIDVNDPNAAAELQQELMDELVKKMGLSSEEAAAIAGDSGMEESALGGNGTEEALSADQNAASDNSGGGWLVSSGKEASDL